MTTAPADNGKWLEGTGINEYDRGGVRGMKKIEQAKIILKHLERYIAVDAAFQEFYIKAILNGLAEIERYKTVSEE
jgi:hypothetical protein